jgi:hypothetical protein
VQHGQSGPESTADHRDQLRRIAAQSRGELRDRFAELEDAAQSRRSRVWREFGVILGADSNSV